MKAVRIHDYGAPEVLCYEDAPIPEPGPRQVRVRVHAAGVNPADRQIRAGLRFRLEQPFAFIPGCEVSGTVEQCGAEVATLAVGDAVYGMLGLLGGGYAEYVVAAADNLGRKPASLDHMHAAALPVAALTAWDALFEVGGLVAGQKVLIHAAAGGVGHIAVQLAKWRGAHVIGTASAGNAAFLRDLGVDEIIDYRTTAFESVVREVDVVVDAIPGKLTMPPMCWPGKRWSVLGQCCGTAGSRSRSAPTRFPVPTRPSGACAARTQLPGPAMIS
jgi:NADPH:quinone reductase-like Zn-dependent oxidoreductase